MPLEPVSVALKFGFLAVLYLFLLWVVRSALRDLQRGTAAASPSDATGLHAASRGLGVRAGSDFDPRLRVERVAGLDHGAEYDLPDHTTLGRGDSVDIRIDDPFASARHASIVRQGDLLVLEDLGSTNGTYLNGELMGGPQPLHPGDVVRIGDNEFSYWQ